VWCCLMKKDSRILSLKLMLKAILRESWCGCPGTYRRSGRKKPLLCWKKGKSLLSRIWQVSWLYKQTWRVAHLVSWLVQSLKMTNIRDQRETLKGHPLQLKADWKFLCVTIVRRLDTCWKGVSPSEKNHSMSERTWYGTRSSATYVLVRATSKSSADRKKRVW
jgi:hypothetical protein